MAFADRNVLLKAPPLLQHEGLLFDLIFVSHDVAGVRRRNSEQFNTNIVDEFAALDLWQGSFDRFLILYLIIFSLCGNTPAAHAVDLFAGRAEMHKNEAIVVAAFG